MVLAFSAVYELIHVKFNQSGEKGVETAVLFPLKTVSTSPIPGLEKQALDVL
jgi:hypothetical protein